MAQGGQCLFMEVQNKCGLPASNRARERPEGNSWFPFGVERRKKRKREREIERERDAFV